MAGYTTRTVDHPARSHRGESLSPRVHLSPARHRAGYAADCRPCQMTAPWALTLRFTLGGASFASRVNLILLHFLSRMSASFPDHNRQLTQRSDEAGATCLPAALEDHPMCRNVPDLHPTFYSCSAHPICGFINFLHFLHHSAHSGGPGLGFGQNC